MLIIRVEDLTKFEGECPIIVVFSTYMDIRIPLTKKWKKIINEKEDKPNTYHNNLIDYISGQIELSGFNMKSIGNLLIKKYVVKDPITLIEWVQGLKPGTVIKIRGIFIYHFL